MTLAPATRPADVTPSREVWVAEMQDLVRRSIDVQWELGDRWRSRPTQYGPGKELAAEIGVDYQTLRHLGSLCERFELCRRRHNLSVAHHAEVKALDSSVADQLLDRAEAENLSRNDLRDLVKEEVKKTKLRERAEQPGASDLPAGCRVEHGDFRQVLADVEDESVDLVLTDPPYDDEALPLFGDLSEWAGRVLKPGGVCAVYTGAQRLPQVLSLLGEHLDYRWTFCLDQQLGSQARYHHVNIMQAWKPIVVFHKAPWTPPPWGKDLLVSPAPEKDRHEWQQNAAPVRELLERFSVPGWVVADPFLGGGTTGFAALDMDRQFIGCDVVAEHVEAFKAAL